MSDRDENVVEAILQQLREERLSNSLMVAESIYDAAVEAGMDAAAKRAAVLGQLLNARELRIAELDAEVERLREGIRLIASRKCTNRPLPSWGCRCTVHIARALLDVEDDR